MKIEDQVCSLELSKLIKEYGIKQESLFYYDYAPHINGVCLDIPILDFWRSPPWDGFKSKRKDKESFISAFTVAELGEMLNNPTPNCILNYKQNDIYICAVGNGPTKLADFEDKNEANSRAKMLIFILENGFIK